MKTRKHRIQVEIPVEGYCVTGKGPACQMLPPSETGQYYMWYCLLFKEELTGYGWSHINRCEACIKKFGLEWKE